MKPQSLACEIPVTRRRRPRANVPWSGNELLSLCSQKRPAASRRFRCRLTRRRALIHPRLRRARSRVSAKHARCHGSRKGLAGRFPSSERCDAGTLRAATIGGTAALTQRSTLNLLLGLAPQSAALQLFALCRQLDFGQATQFAIPYVSTRPTFPFVQEGQPIPAGQPALGSVVVGPPSKIAFIVSLTRELQNATPSNAATVIGSLLGECLARSLDTFVFDNAAAVAGLRPAGLLNGLTPIAAATAAGSIVDTIASDFAGLVGAFSAAGLNAANAVAILNPVERVKLALTRGYDPTALSVFATPGIPAATIVATIPQGIYVGFQDEPTIEFSTSPSIVMNDVPADLVSGAGAVGAPAISMFQSDRIAVKLRFWATWAAVAPGCVQTISGAHW
jgi:hypothetical protein